MERQTDGHTHLQRCENVFNEIIQAGPKKKIVLREKGNIEALTSVLFFLPGIMLFAYNYVVYMRFFAFKPKRIKKKEIIVF